MANKQNGGDAGLHNRREDHDVGRRGDEGHNRPHPRDIRQAKKTTRIPTWNKEHGRTAINLSEAINIAACSAKNGKAADDSGLSNACIKSIREEVTQCIAEVLRNNTEAQETLPMHWKQARGLLLHKKGDKENLSNYRLLSISPTLSRFMGSIFCQQLRPILEHHYGPEQHGFRKGHSTISLLHILETIIHNAIAAKKK